METVKLNIHLEQKLHFVYLQLINGLCLELTVLCRQVLLKLFSGTRLLWHPRGLEHISHTPGLL
jgi:hypothetical protein